MVKFGCESSKGESVVFGRDKTQSAKRENPRGKGTKTESGIRYIIKKDGRKQGMKQSIGIAAAAVFLCFAALAHV